ncbi:DNA repair exonuclease [Methanogenium sp. S4BF]|uniref:metallophosphoesterase family protein n=1 Tax=Methanogenium sp. S4BF TaxID=1789226 RepID=UPI00241652F6|nr:DNA repair exonuclease [Methanogenium sp. S4BF]WFN34346.1 DNA repair exonuclease [Methanogenium sp. S4BF]
MPAPLEQTPPSNRTDIRFIHAADLHLGTPFTGISKFSPEFGDILAYATYRAFEEIVSLAIREQVNFLLISGDIYDSEERRIYGQLIVRKQLQRLSDAGIRTYIAFGNHDPLDGWSAHISWPEGVHVMPGDAPEVAYYPADDDRMAAIVGMSFARKAVSENLASRFPSKGRDWPVTIGLLHCTAGAGGGHVPYAPCSVEDLLQSGYDYWALGHIHTPVVLRENNPAIIYSGNPQGRDFGECGPRGCYIVTMKESGTVVYDFIETCRIRWEEHEISIEGMEDTNALITAMEGAIADIRANAGGKGTICRFTLTGRGPVHAVLARNGATEEILDAVREGECPAPDFVLTEKIIDRTEHPVDRESVACRTDIVGDIIQISDCLMQEDTTDTIRGELSELYENPRVKRHLEMLTDDEIVTLVREAETYLLDQFVGDDSE